MGPVKPRALPRNWNVGGAMLGRQRGCERAKVEKVLAPTPNTEDRVQDYVRGLRRRGEVGKGRRQSNRVPIGLEQRALPTRPRSASC